MSILKPVGEISTIEPSDRQDRKSREQQWVRSANLIARARTVLSLSGACFCLISRLGQSYFARDPITVVTEEALIVSSEP